jgi:hypothetical protein
MLIQELRIGNWVVDDEGYYCQVSRLTSKKFDDYEKQEDVFMVEFENNNTIYESERIEPIPLTPEILEKAGFEVSSKGFFSHPKWYNLSLKHRTGSYDLRCNFMERVATNIDYVHQLQNLFQSLTGEELVINL